MHIYTNVFAFACSFLNEKNACEYIHYIYIHMHIAHLSYVYITIGFIFQFIDHLTISVFIAVPCRAGLP
jgi:hypothetical protein